MTANLTHSILCVMLPKQHLEPKSQVPQLWLMAPDDKKASVLRQHQKQWRIRVGVYGLWIDLGRQESKPQLPVYTTILTDGIFLARVQGPWSPSELSLTPCCRYPRCPGTQDLLMNHLEAVSVYVLNECS